MDNLNSRIPVPRNKIICRLASIGVRRLKKYFNVMRRMICESILMRRMICESILMGRMICESILMGSNVKNDT